MKATKDELDHLEHDIYEWFVIHACVPSNVRFDEDGMPLAKDYINWLGICHAVATENYNSFVEKIKDYIELPKHKTIEINSK